MTKCNYGCGQPAKFKTSNNKDCCSAHYNSCPAIREKNSLGLKVAHTSGKMRKFTADDVAKSNKASIENAIVTHFVENSTVPTEHIKKFLYRDFGYLHRCLHCGLTEWNSSPITLELDHVNGNNRDNRLQNLRLLCPNCHSQTATWRGRNINNGKTKVSDKLLLTALKETSNIRQALLSVGLAAKGANYARANTLLSK